MLGTASLILILSLAVITTAAGACLVAFSVYRAVVSVLEKYSEATEVEAEERKYLQEFIFSRLDFDKYAAHELAQKQVEAQAEAPKVTPVAEPARVPVTLSDFDL